MSDPLTPEGLSELRRHATPTMHLLGDDVLRLLATVDAAEARAVAAGTALGIALRQLAVLCRHVGDETYVALLDVPDQPNPTRVVIKNDACSVSKRADGQHSWRFDGDDPYVICVFCDEIRDAHNGRVLRPAAVPDQPNPTSEPTPTVDSQGEPCGSCGGHGTRYVAGEWSPCPNCWADVPDQPNTAGTSYECECGHGVDDHADEGIAPCLAERCECDHYRDTGAPVPDQPNPDADGMPKTDGHVDPNGEPNPSIIGEPELHEACGTHHYWAITPCPTPGTGQ